MGCGNTSAIISVDCCGGTIFCGFGRGMVDDDDDDDDDVCFIAIGGNDLRDTTSMSR